jgi:glycosyltransferase involved in cell wall biosynthesis
MKPHDNPRVSVLMPMRNAGVFLRPAIDSVLLQHQEPLELIVVDDGSTDGSSDVARSVGDPRIRVLEGRRRGIAAGLNLALSEARGDIVMRCDADDLYPPDRIRRQLDWLAAHPQYAAVCGPFATIDRRGDVVSALGPWPAEPVVEAASWILSRRLSTTLCAFAIRRETMQGLGGFRSYFETAEDIDFLLRLAQRAAIAYLPGNAYFYRLHNDSITHTQATPRRAFFEDAAYAMALEREIRGADALMRGQAPMPPSGEGAGRAHVHTADSHVAALLVGEAWQWHSRGDTTAARASAWRALRADRRSWAAWKTLALVWLRRPTSGTARR